MDSIEVIKQKKREYMRKYRRTEKGREYHQKYMRVYKEKNKERLRQLNYEYRHRDPEKIRLIAMTTYRRVRMDALTHYGGNPPKCACCNEQHLEFLTIDHVNNDGAEHRRRRKNHVLYWELRQQNYPLGFRVLCMNCNFARSRNRICPHEND